MQDRRAESHHPVARPAFYPLHSANLQHPFPFSGRGWSPLPGDQAGLSPLPFCPARNEPADSTASPWTPSLPNLHTCTYMHMHAHVYTDLHVYRIHAQMTVHSYIH